MPFREIALFHSQTGSRKLMCYTAYNNLSIATLIPPYFTHWFLQDLDAKGASHFVNIKKPVCSHCSICSLPARSLPSFFRKLTAFQPQPSSQPAVNAAFAAFQSLSSSLPALSSESPQLAFQLAVFKPASNQLHSKKLCSKPGILTQNYDFSTSRKAAETLPSLLCFQEPRRGEY